MSDTTTTDTTRETPKVPNSAAIRRMAANLEGVDYLTRALLDAQRARLEADRAYRAIRRMAMEALEGLE
jgi:hypothetical protein